MAIFANAWLWSGIIVVALGAALAGTVYWLNYRSAVLNSAQRNAVLLQSAPAERVRLFQIASEDMGRSPDTYPNLSLQKHGERRVPVWATVDERDAKEAERGGSDPKLFWNKAVVARCDARPNVRIDSFRGSIDAAKYLAQIAEAPRERAATTYVIATQLGRFADEVLPNLTREIVLISGCDDLGPAQALTSKQLTSVLGSSNVRAWFAQNCDFVHPKLLPLPIGLDFHTLDPARGSKVFRWGPRRTPANQEQLIDKLVRAAPKRADDRTEACVINVTAWSNREQRIPVLSAAQEQ